MRLKKKKKIIKDARINFKISTEEKNKLQLKANLYTEGNLSEYLIYCGLNFVANKSDLEKSEK